MHLTTATKYRKREDGTVEAYPYYRLTESYRDASGTKRSRSVLCLGDLEGFSAGEREELARMLTSMIVRGEHVAHENVALREKALEFYVKYRESRYARENDPVLRAEYERAQAERRRSMVTVRLDTLTQHEARCVGRENVCASTLRQLDVRGYLRSRGWKGEDIDLALMQIVSRCIYPYSELKTVRYLRENSGLREMFHIPERAVTKDALYRSALRLSQEGRGLEDFLHRRVCSMFDIEEDILLLDITNTYFEGRYEDSGICRYGRSKEKRRDCKIVVLAAVVNTEGLLVRTAIYEGNRHDSTTVEEVVGSISVPGGLGRKRQIVVMDAGFYSEGNVAWLTSRGYDYITVLPSGESHFEATSDRIVRQEDCRHQEIRLQLGQVPIDGTPHKALLVDSDAKTLKERSMYEQACQRYAEGLASIKAGTEIKGGTKSRDAVNRRLGRLNQKYGAIRKSFTVEMEYKMKGKTEQVSSFTWRRNDGHSGQTMKFHGKYVLLTSLDESDEANIWHFYNVIRTVEETFHILKTDLDIRPVFHKTDSGIKAHLNLAVLAYWVVSVTKHKLKVNGYENVRWDEIMRIASTQVAVTARVETSRGDIVSIRQCTQPEDGLAKICKVLGISPHPIPKVKSVVHPNQALKKIVFGNHGVT